MTLFVLPPIASRKRPRVPFLPLALVAKLHIETTRRSPNVIAHGGQWYAQDTSGNWVPQA